MTFITKLILQSGDRAVLDSVVEDIRSTTERKGVEMNGPHSKSPERLRVPQAKRTTGGAEFASWDYTVYTREIEIVGHDDIARKIAAKQFPNSLHVEVEVKQISQVGSGS
jgi:ribosomal protein S10